MPNPKLDTLIRLSQERIDELRRNLAELETQRDQLAEALRRTREQLDHERSIVSNEVSISSYFPAYAKRNLARQEELVESITNLEQLIDELRDVLRDAFTEMKKYELVRERQAEEEAYAEKLREQAELDEMAQTMRRLAEEEEEH